MWDSSRQARVDHAVAAIRLLLDRLELVGIVLTKPGSVSWVTGGMNPTIDRSAPTDELWVVVTRTTVTIVTTEVESPRVIAEQSPDAYGIDVVAVNWWDAGVRVSAARSAAGGNLPRGIVGSDGHPAFEFDISDAIAEQRMALCAEEIDVLRALGRDAAEALESALETWVPGETDFQIQSRVVAAIESVGGEASVVLVGTDDRVRQFRHPAACGAAAESLVMAVLVARRSGLHVAATRYGYRGAIPAELEDGLAAVRDIQNSALEATRPGARWGDPLLALYEAYATAGSPGAWRQHYQGGPIGFAQREFEISPTQRRSRWWSTPIVAGTAVAWNPSLPGGAKAEDTYLTAADGLELITRRDEKALGAASGSRTEFLCS